MMLVNSPVMVSPPFHPACKPLSRQQIVRRILALWDAGRKTEAGILDAALCSAERGTKFVPQDLPLNPS